MMTIRTEARARLLGASALALVASFCANAAAAETVPAAATEQKADPATKSDIAEGSDIVVTATKANELAPVTASLKTTQPQAIVSRSFIEDSLPATVDFNQIALITPSVSNFGGNNGIGLSESKAQLRGFQDGEYNITYDGVPFGDTNDPTHHSTTFFPSNTVETLIVDRGPGNASNLGQASFGGTFNLFSRATRDDFGGEVVGSYGSFNTYLARGLLQTGTFANGAQAVFSGQYVHSDGRTSYSKYQNYNLFGKVVVPVTPDVKVTFLATYNKNRFNQADNDGSTLAQQALYGKYYGLNNDPNTSEYFGYNHTDKTTDFEIIKLEANLSPGAVFENRAYTYYYDNETLSANDVTTQPGIAGFKPYQTIGANGKAIVGDIPGYTKTNKYRVFGDIAKVRIDLASFATITAGAWLEFSHTYRQQRDVDLTTGGFNYVEKVVKAPATGLNPGELTPQYIKFDQKSRGNHTEEFVELEIRPIEGLKITPGFKHVDFGRKIDALYNQTTRYAQRNSNDYAADLPFVTINYQPLANFSVYGQYAKGFLAPPLSQLYVANTTFSNAVPQKSTNYQAGAVYHGSHLSLDADVYVINFTNKFYSYTDTSGQGLGTIFTNIGGALYKGVEGQATYAFGNGLAIFANASRNYAKTNVYTDPVTGKVVPRTTIAKAPQSTAAGGVLYKHGPIKFSLTDKWTGPQYSDLANTVRISPYNTVNLAASYAIGPIKVGIDVTDLLDSQKINQISGTLATGQIYYQPGRAVSGQITYSF
ncbi:TonB-dependent receptor [Sphingomonas sp.]|jgi:iron complex outermembrane receptor protein|uniref:TonB-dependent receptor n=1 Tax=Sphingomonas sp. TaxID=28214 RepID=UPI0035665E48